MWPAFSRLAAVFCTGLAVKIMDDAVDAEFDLLTGRPGLTAGLGSGAVPYVGLCLVTAVLLSMPDACALFLCSYALGMAQAPGTTVAWGGRAWHESALAFVVGAVALGPKAMGPAAVLVVAVQLGDHARDRTAPAAAGGWYRGEYAVASAFLFGFGAGMDPLLALGAGLVTAAIWGAEVWRQARAAA